jgi:hypothetical protein
MVVDWLSGPGRAESVEYFQGVQIDEDQVCVRVRYCETQQMAQLCFVQQCGSARNQKNSKVDENSKPWPYDWSLISKLSPCLYSSSPWQCASTLGQIHATYILQDHQPDWLGCQQTSDAA